jgi:hypothetical protein
MTCLAAFVLKLLNPVGVWHLVENPWLNPHMFAPMLRPYMKATQTELEPEKCVSARINGVN